MDLNPKGRISTNRIAEFMERRFGDEDRDGV
jgi:hypothetical protein